MALDELRRRVEQLIELLIEFLDYLDSASEDLDDTGEAEPDDTGIADTDALGEIEPAHRDWFEDDEKT